MVEDREYEVMASVEDRHFWFIGTRAAVRDAFLATGLPRESRCLDVGCGTGGTMRAMAGLARFTGLDISAKAAEFCVRRTGNQVVVGMATDLPFGDASFDCVLALDVFEHIEDDALAMREVRRVLRPGGMLIATVPCHQALYSEHDRALHHVRRYSRSVFLALVESGGFTPRRVTWTNFILFPVAAGHRLVSRLLPERPEAESDAAVSLGPLNGVFKAVMQAEAAILRHVDLPWGLSLMVVAERKRSPP